MFMIVDGEARLVRNSATGATIIVQRASQGSFIAEASLFTPKYHCDAIATTDVTAKVFLRAELRRKFETDYEFTRIWVDNLANEVRSARLRTEILSLKTVAERLTAWTESYGRLPNKGNWKQLAHELGVSPEALYRELAKQSS